MTGQLKGKDMNGQTVTQSYCLGIREGRPTLNRFQYDGIACLSVAREALANARARLSSGLSDEMREFTQGEHDFWLNQVGKLGMLEEARNV